MGLFSRKPKTNLAAQKYQGSLRPPPSIAAKNREVSTLPMKQKIPKSTREALPLPVTQSVCNGRSHFVIVSLAKVDKNAKEWWTEFFEKWIDDGREFDYVDATDEGKPEYVTENSVILFARSQDEMIQTENTINLNANMRRAAFTHEVEV